MNFSYIHISEFVQCIKFLYSGIYLLSTKILRKAKVKQFPQLSLTSRPENLQAAKILGLTRALIAKHKTLESGLILTQVNKFVMN